MRCVTSHIPAGNYSGILRRTWPPGDGVRGCTWVSHRSNFTLAIPVYPRHANWQEVACRSRWPEGVLTLTHAAQRLDSLYNAGQVADVQPLLLGIHEARGADLEHLRSESAGNAWWRINALVVASERQTRPRMLTRRSLTMIWPWLPPSPQGFAADATAFSAITATPNKYCALLLSRLPQCDQRV